MAAISLKGIAKSFGSVEVLHDISLDIAAGEFLTLLGPSGCGKSTLLRIVAGLERQSAGSVDIGDRRVDALPARDRDIAMVFQSYALYPHMTVAANIGLPLTMRRMNLWQRLPLLGPLLPGVRAARAAISRDVAEAAGALDIAMLLDRKPGQLSGGQKQRVALGRAMVRHPAAFLLDEPLSNLDAKLRVQMRAELTELQRRLGATMIYVTHDQTEALTMSDRVAVMLSGRLQQVAAPRRLYDDPQTLAVAEFVGSPKINVIPAAEGFHAVRPEALHLVTAGTPGAIAGKVRLVEHTGAECLIHVDASNLPQPLIARIDASAAHTPQRGEALSLLPQKDRVLRFDTSGRRIRG